MRTSEAALDETKAHEGEEVPWPPREPVETFAERRIRIIVEGYMARYNAALPPVDSQPDDAVLP